MGCGRVTRQRLRHVESRGANSIVRHAVVNVETIRRTEIIATIDPGREYDVVDRSVALQLPCRNEHRLGRAIDHPARLILREYQRAGGITHLLPRGARWRKAMYAMIEGQPSVPAEDGRRAAADLEALPRRHRACQGVMGGELAQASLLRIQAAIRDPDTLAMRVGPENRGLVHLLFRTGPREQRSVDECDCRLAVGIRNQRGKNVASLLSTPAKAMPL